MSLLVVSANTEAFFDFTKNSAVHDWGRTTQEQIVDWVEKEILDDEISYRVEYIQPDLAEFFFNRFDEVWVELYGVFIQASSMAGFKALMHAYMVNGIKNHKLDIDTQVLFHEHGFDALSNFSAFKLCWRGLHFHTAAAAYHWEEFASVTGEMAGVADAIYRAHSAHAAFEIAHRFKAYRRENWDNIKVDVMRSILIEKCKQHEYVRRKLLETGDRELVEDSWRDDYWGVGFNGDGKNMLGVLWMEIRTAIRETPEKFTLPDGEWVPDKDIDHMYPTPEYYRDSDET